MTEEHRQPREHGLNEYERAVCYYTIPRVAHPLTIGLIAVYAVCLLEAVGALAFGLITQHPVWTRAGVIALFGIILLGIVAFMGRALLNDFRQRRVLAQARGDIGDPDRKAELPDPFSGNRLFECPRSRTQKPFEIVDEHGAAVYRADFGANNRWLRLHNVDGGPPIEAQGRGHGNSFLLGGLPRGLDVTCEGEEVGAIRSRFAFMGQRLEIIVTEPYGRIYDVRDRSIYFEERLVGRIYYLRRSLFLDIEKDHLDPTFLVFLAALA